MSQKAGKLLRAEEWFMMQNGNFVFKVRKGDRQKRWGEKGPAFIAVFKGGSE